MVLHKSPEIKVAGPGTVHAPLIYLIANGNNQSHYEWPSGTVIGWYDESMIYLRTIRTGKLIFVL